MFEEQAYQTTWDLFSTIPSLEDPDVTVRQEILDFNSTFKTHARARLVDGKHRILDASSYGLSAADRFAMTGMLAMSEKTLGARRIDLRRAPLREQLLADVAKHVRLPEVALGH